MTQISFSMPLTNFVEQRTKSFICYSRSWYSLMESIYGYSFVPLTTSDTSGQINGFLPLCYIKSPLTGRRIVSLPFSDYCPLLAANEEVANDLIDQAIHLAQRKRVKYLELRSGPNAALEKRAELKAHDLYVRWFLPLPDDPDTLWSHLRKEIQRHIGKAQKQGVHIRMAERTEDIQQYYRLHLLTRSKKHGMPTQPGKYFTQLWTTFHPQGKMQVFLAEYNEQVIAGLVLFISEDTLQVGYAAADAQFLHLSPNHLLHWTAMKWGCTHRYTTYDFGRTAIDNDGLMEFKRRWGAIQEPLTYYYYPRVAGLAATSEKSQLYRVLTTCWQRLPLSLARPLSGLIYKHMG